MIENTMLSAIKQEIRPTLKLAIPMILTQLLGYGQQIIDTIMAGQHDKLTLAGVSLAGSLFGLIFLLMIGIGIGFSAQLSRHHGSDDRHAIRQDFQQGIWLYLVLGSITTFATAIAAYIPPFIGSQADIALEAKRYLLALALPAGIYTFASLARYFLESMAHPRTNNLVTAALLPINIIGNFLFLNYTTLGAQGMAIATGICYILYAIIIFSMIMRDKRWKKYRLFRYLSAPHWKNIFHLMLIGLPIGVSIVMEAGMFSFISIMASRENAAITSANQIAVNYIGIMFMIPLGISAALTIRCANALGRNDWQAISIRAITGIILSAIFMFFASIIILLAREPIAAIYTSNQEIIIAAASILFIVAFLEIVDGIQVAASGVLRGLADTRITLIYAIIGYWIIGVPVGCLISYGFGVGFLGLWIGCAIGLTVFSILALQRVIHHIHAHKEPPHG